MIVESRVDDFTVNRRKILEYLREQKTADPSFSVVDVGGSAGGWTHGVADVIVDINPVNAARYFKVNLNRSSDWTEILDYVKANGKFSFAICSHTLEDIANPMLVMDMLPQIAKEGYIAVPSKYRELSKIEGKWIGYLHHRWIFDILSREPTVVVGYPKLGFLEYATNLHARVGNTSDSLAELSFRWKDRIPYRIVNDDYLGPSSAAVQTYYQDLFLR